MNFTNYESFQKAFSKKLLSLKDAPEIVFSNNDFLLSREHYLFTFQTEENPNVPEHLLISKMIIQFTYKKKGILLMMFGKIV